MTLSNVVLLRTKPDLEKDPNPRSMVLVGYAIKPSPVHEHAWNIDRTFLGSSIIARNLLLEKDSIALFLEIEQLWYDDNINIDYGCAIVVYDGQLLAVNRYHLDRMFEPI